MEISPVAWFRSPVEGKFGLPRQSSLASSLKGEIVLQPPYDSPDALRGLEDSIIYGLYGASTSTGLETSPHLTVRPPRLGGNRRVGVFASRSPYRPNPLGLSSVRIEHIDFDRGVITVFGADLADGTPIYDIKPYIEYADSHSGVRSGFADSSIWQRLEVVFPDSLASEFNPGELEALRELLSEDPRPQYHSEAERIYGLKYLGRDIRFRVEGDTLSVLETV